MLPSNQKVGTLPVGAKLAPALGVHSHWVRGQSAPRNFITQPLTPSAWLRSAGGWLSYHIPEETTTISRHAFICVQQSPLTHTHTLSYLEALGTLTHCHTWRLWGRSHTVIPGGSGDAHTLSYLEALGTLTHCHTWRHSHTVVPGGFGDVRESVHVHYIREL